MTSWNLNKAFSFIALPRISRQLRRPVNVKIKEMSIAEIPSVRDFVFLIKCDYCQKPFSVRLPQS